MPQGKDNRYWYKSSYKPLPFDLYWNACPLSGSKISEGTLTDDFISKTKNVEKQLASYKYDERVTLYLTVLKGHDVTLFLKHRPSNGNVAPGL
jgi:hypothetical protein